ncbi:MAG: vanadium-dependent haloperoxidase [Saprospiraceae bacterium]
MNFFKLLLKPTTLVLLLTTVFVFISCDPDDDDDEVSIETALAKDYDGDVVTSWIRVFSEVERHAPGYRPGPAPRALAYLGLAAYEATITAMPEYNSLESIYRAQGLDIPNIEQGVTYHWPTVVNASYGYLMKRFFPHVKAELRFKISSTETQFDVKYLETEGVPRDIFERSKRYGQSVAEAVYSWSSTDKTGHEAFRDPRPSNYVPPTGEGKWIPTYPDAGAAMFPSWGEARTFAIKGEERLCLPPLEYSADKNSPLYKEAMEVYTKNTPKLDYEEQWIAEYWSDDALDITFSPPTRFIVIANQVLEAKKANLELAVYTAAKVGISLNDAGVAAWHSKYYYNIERPVTYIRREIDPSWEPHLWFTPSFPAYPSGHATFGAAGSEALTSIFGDKYAMVDRSHEGRIDFLGTPRSFKSFYEMAEENAYSRIPLGVHFRMDAEEGLRLGYAIGRKVSSLPWKK